MALLSGFALSPELVGQYGRHSKYRDRVSVLCVRTSWSLASLPSPASHRLDPLALYCYTLLAGILPPSAGTSSASSSLLAPLLLSGSPHWVTPLAFFTHYAIYSTVATSCSYSGSWYSTASLAWTTFRGAPIQWALRPCLVFVTGRGGAGFHSPGPALTRGRGGYF